MPTERHSPETDQTARQLAEIADRLGRLRTELDDRVRQLLARDEAEAHAIDDGEPRRPAGGRPQG